MELDEKRGYLIPDVLPHPSVILIYGAGGDGKSTAAGRSLSTLQLVSHSSSRC